MDSVGIVSIFLFSVLLTTVSSQTNVVSTSTIKDGGTFNLYCDANRVTFPVGGVTDISALTLSRKVATDTDFVAIAQYKTSGSDPQVQKPPNGRPWVTNFTGANNGANNRNTMKIETAVPNAICGDAGLYKCIVRYTDPVTKVDDDLPSPVQNVTAEAGISQLTLSLSPNNLESDNSASYYEGTYLQMTCRVNGPETLKLVWTQKSEMGFAFSQYPISNDITAQTSSPVTSGSCNEYIHTTMLSFNVTQFSNDGYSYKCEVRQTLNGPELMNRNVTLAISGSTPQPGPATGGSSDPDVGMIVGIVVGVLALIIIVIVVVVIVMKKKKAKGDKYADNEAHDAPNDPNLHAPPPVFYSKPSKPPKDERDNTIPAGMTNEALDTSYDSKDSANRGPPRYANADPDVNGLPRYEKESHRGRQNRGYNEEDAERNGHGRRYPRDERRSRSHDVDDEPRARHYSTEDGTDDRGYSGFGDPSIGTAI